MLTTWIWITYQELFPGENWFLFSHSHWLSIAFHLWVELWTASPIYIDMSASVIMQVLLGQPYCWDFCGCSFPVISRGHSRFNLPGPLHLKIFLPTFAWFPWTLDKGLHCRYVNCDSVAHNHLFSALWPTVDLCSTLHLSWKSPLSSVCIFICSWTWGHTGARLACQGLSPKENWLLFSQESLPVHSSSPFLP